MPTYQYKCNSCKKKFEIFLTFEEYDKGNAACPKCYSDNVARRYDNTPYVTVTGEAKTIGQIADRNTKKNKSKIDEYQAANKTTKEKPWYYNKDATASRKEINKMTKEQKQKYIMEGK